MINITTEMWFLVVIIPFIMSFFCVMLIHPAIVKAASYRKLTDRPNARKLQARPIPMLGGMAVFMGIIFSMGITSILFNSYALFTCVFALTLMMYMGTIDDFVGLRPSVRILIEIFVICFVIVMDQVNMNDFHGIFGVEKLPIYVSLPLCIVGGVGIINAMNMIDGVDGLSSGLGIFICGVFGMVFFVSHVFLMAVLAFITMGALIPFFLKNVFGVRSKMFIGDSGTMMLGVIMVIFCMYSIDDSSRIARLYPKFAVIPFCIATLSVPVFDTVRVMAQRIWRGVSPFSADKTHLHHTFVALGFSHIGTTFSILCIEAVNVAVFFAAYLLGLSVNMQLLVVMITGVGTVIGVHYGLSALRSTSEAYHFLRRIGVSTKRFEQSDFFKLMRILADFSLTAGRHKTNVFDKPNEQSQTSGV